MLFRSILKEVPIPLSSGGLSTGFELVLEVNYVDLTEESVELEKLNNKEKEDFEELATRINEKGI